MNNKNGDIVNFNFSRATNATYFDNLLNLHSANTNIPRIDYGTYTTNPKILIEKNSTNYILSSKNIVTGGTLENVADPNFGTVLKFKEDTASGNHRLALDNRPTGSLSVTTNYIKYVDRDYVLVRQYLGDMTAFSLYDLKNKTVFKNVGSTTGAITELPNGWLRLVTKGTGGSLNTLISVIDAVKDTSITTAANIYVGEGKEFITGLNQLEISTENTSYIPPAPLVETTRSSDFLSYTLTENTRVYLKTTKKEVELEKSSGIWNIEEDLNNEGIYALAIF